MSNLKLHRDNLFNLMDDNSVLLIHAGVEKVSSADETFPFVVNKHFFYLTGITQSNSSIMLIKTFGERKTYLFVDEYSEFKEKWYGRKLTADEAREISGINSIFVTSELNTMLDLALSNVSNQYGSIKKCYIDMTPETKIGDELSTKELVNQLKDKHNHIEFDDAARLVTELRMVKDEEEIEKLVKAIELTNHGLMDLVLNLHPGIKEFEISDRFEFYGRSHGRHGLSFSTIIASGKNATCLHYPVTLQNDTVKDDDLILCDLGYEYDGYHADITRTYPMNGKFNDLQRKIYTGVLNCNKACIEYAKAGLPLKELHNYSVEFLKKECIRLGLMDETDDIKNYYYHGIGHNLGLDTHDVGGRDVILKPGMVITIEPGLYFAKYGIGVRIEDDIEITDGHAIVLSNSIKKEIEDIERLFKQKGNI